MTGLVIHSLKNKRNWFLLNIAICVVITIVLPLLFKTAYEFFAVSSLIIASAIILISTFSDLVFLHDDRKISYYLSKPISLIEKLNISLISNVIFCTVTFVITFLIASAAGSVLSDIKYTNFVYDYLSYCQVIYAWLLVLIFVVTFASELTGNTTVSVLVSIFIFTLPLIIYFITTYIFYILDTVIVGISSEIMLEMFINKILPLDKIYFIDYGIRGSLNIFFFIRLVGICAVIYIVSLLFAKKRRNENTGNFVVHSSFKYFMSLFASLITPMLITMVMMGSNLLTLVTTLVVLSTLSYYILISAFNKTFKISVSALKIFIPFILIIIITIFTASAILNDKAAYVPNESEVKAVYIGDSPRYLKDASLLKKTSHNWESILNKKYDEIKNNDSIVLINKTDNIKKVTEIQKLLMNNDNSNSYREVYFIYYLNNGKRIIRTYKVPDSYNEELSEEEIGINKAIMELARTEEYINKKYKVFTDENYINTVEFYNIYSYNENGRKSLNDFDYELFAKAFIDDYRTFINDDSNAEKISYNLFSSIKSYEFVHDRYIKDAVIAEENVSSSYDLNFEYQAYDGISPEYVTITKEMVKTREYLNSLK